MTDYITARQAAELTGYSYQYIIKALAAGKIDGARRFGKAWQIPYAWVEAHIKPLTITQQARDMGISRETYYKRKKRNRKMTDMVDFEDYLKACIDFYNVSSDWLYLPSNFFTTNPYEYQGWSETCDNAHGGLDVSWVFGRRAYGGAEDVKRYAWEHYVDNIQSLIDLIKDEKIEWTEARLAPEGTAMQDKDLKRWKEYIADLEALIKQPA